MHPTYLWRSVLGWLVLCTVLSMTPPIKASTCHQTFKANSYPSCAQLSPNVSLHWSVQDGSITWALDVDGVWDWVGVGLSEGGMLGADLAIATHDPAAAQWSAADYWATDFTTPQRDTQQDVTLVSVERQSYGGDSGSTLVAMRRPLETCDKDGMDRPVLYDTPQIVVFAYGSGQLGYHGPVNRGQYELVLMPNTSKAAPSSADVPLEVLELRMPNLTVPTAPTSYMCVNLALPFASKSHLYRYEPLLDNTALVHHFVAYACTGPQPPPTPLGLPYDCLRYMECDEFWLGWAPGVGAVEAPAEAALAFGPGSGGGGGAGLRYVALQLHYTNLDAREGRTDSSGFRLLYSSVLKRYDMGVLTLGSYDIAVPPGAATWSTQPNVCPGACTAAMMAGATAAAAIAPAAPPPALTLVESFYHMHGLGRAAVTRHVRGGVELPPLGERRFFEFGYQAPVSIPPSARQLLPGDMLITSCTYSGEGRGNVTRFGLASYEEMCFNFLTYYPYNASVANCIAMNSINLATCTTGFNYEHFKNQDAVQAAVKAGELLPLPANTSFRPYAPTCVRSAPSGASTGSSAIPDSDTSGSAAAAASRHRRNVGGAVAGILLVTVVGAVAIVVVSRLMRKKRQEEEEQHLFDKYNPNSFTLPVIAGTGTGTGSHAVAGGAAAGNASSTTAAAAAGYHSSSSSSDNKDKAQKDAPGAGSKKKGGGEDDEGSDHGHDARSNRSAGYTELSRSSEAV